MDTLSSGLLISFLVLSAIIILLLIFSPITRKIGVRNVYRRIANTILVVIGCLVGTALITGSLVLSDSLDKTFYQLVENNLGEIDALVNITPNKLTTEPIVGINDEELKLIRDGFNERDEIESYVGFLNLLTSPVKIDENGNPVLNAYNVGLTGININKLILFSKIDDLNKITNNEIIVSESVAEDLELKVSDKIKIEILGKILILEVNQIHKDEGFIGGPTIIVNEDYLFKEFGLPEERYNTIAVSNVGGTEPENYDGAKLKTLIQESIEEAELTDYNFSVIEYKQTALDGFGLGFFVDIFILFSAFGVLSGMLLIVNLFSMLASERKTEMGILRAIALSRMQLVKAFVFEGFVYSIISALFGTIIGVAVGYFIVISLTSIFQETFSSVDSGPTLEILFNVTSTTLIISFATGALITIITSIFSSYRISKLNIVEAIRGINAEIKVKITLKWVIVTLMQLAYAVIFIFMFITSFGIEDAFDSAKKQNPESFKSFTDSQFDELALVVRAYLFYISVILFLLVINLLINRFLNQFRKDKYTGIVTSIISLIALVFTSLISNISFVYEALDTSMGSALFFISSTVLVISLSLLVSNNLDIIVWIISKIFNRVPSIKLLTELPLRYTSLNKSRTNLTLIMFSLIIFLIVFISISKGISVEQNNRIIRSSLGGYDLIIFPGQDKVVNTAERIEKALDGKDYIKDLQKISATQIIMPDYQYKDLEAPQVQGGPQFQFDFKDDDFYRTELNSIPKDYLINSEIELSSFSSDYKNSKEAWEDVINSKDKVILGTNFSQTQDFLPKPNIKIGDKIKIADIFGQQTRTVTVVGNMDSNGNGALGLFAGIIIPSDNLEVYLTDEYVKQFSTSTILLDTKDNQEDVKNAVKKDLINENVSLILTIDDIAGVAQVLINGLLNLIQGFLAFSLIVGSSGLAIILVRSVNERRQQIGMLRSLGFTRSDILSIFYIESTFITTLAIIIGVSMGILGTYSLIQSAAQVEEVNLDFIIPWGEILILILVVYLASIIFSILPSRKAASLNPVEATNYPE